MRLPRWESFRSALLFQYPSKSDNYFNYNSVKLQGSLNKFPDFFRKGTFIDSTYKNSCSIHARCSKSSLKHSIRFCSIFPSLKQNLIAYRSSKVSSHLDCIFEIHQLWQSGFGRVYSNCCCSCSFEAEIIKIDQSSHKVYSNNILNSQESTTILSACTKTSENILNTPRTSTGDCFFSISICPFPLRNSSVLKRHHSQSRLACEKYIQQLYFFSDSGGCIYCIFFGVYCWRVCAFYYFWPSFLLAYHLKMIFLFAIWTCFTQPWVSLRISLTTIFAFDNELGCVVCLLIIFLLVELFNQF